jgi:putative ABC transport system permease protein
VLTPALVSLGIIWACVIGLVGGLFPALHAARLPVAQALRAV